MRSPRALASLGLAVGLVALLPRMRRDFDADGAFGTGTASAMWAAYGLGAVLYSDALRSDGERTRPAVKAVGATAAAAGLGLTAAGMGRFGSAGKVAGTEASGLETGGAYRVSRNPQYAGFVIAGLGGALARRSPFAAELTLAYGLICAWWVRVEEGALEREYGDEYRTFRATTSRWLGRPSRG